MRLKQHVVLDVEQAQKLDDGDAISAQSVPTW